MAANTLGKNTIVNIFQHSKIHPRVLMIAWLLKGKYIFCHMLTSMNMSAAQQVQNKLKFFVVD